MNRKKTQKLNKEKKRESAKDGRNEAKQSTREAQVSLGNDRDPRPWSDRPSIEKMRGRNKKL